MVLGMGAVGWGVISSLAGGLLGGLAQQSANAANEARYQEILKLYQDAMERQRMLYGMAGDTLLMAPETITQGYEQARAELGKISQAGKRNVLEREQQVGADINQDMVNRGLASTTVSGNMRRGLAGDTQRQLRDIDASMAGMYSGLRTGEAGAMTGALGNLANYYAGRSGAETGLTSDLAHIMAGKQDQYSGGWGQALGGLGNMLMLGGMFGGGGGGGGIPPLGPGGTGMGLWPS